MKLILSRFKWFSILIVIELFFYFRIPSESYEMFFFGWGMLALILLLNNLFRRDDNVPMIGIGASSSTRYAYMSTTLVETQSQGRKMKKLGNGIFDYANLAYLILLLINVICYILVMPE
ncbi:hypothetical protein [Fusibacter bizertensis]